MMGDYADTLIEQAEEAAYTQSEEWENAYIHEARAEAVAAERARIRAVVEAMTRTRMGPYMHNEYVNYVSVLAAIDADGTL